MPQSMLISQAENRSCELVINRGGYSFFQYRRVDYLSHLGNWGIYPISGRAKKVPNYLTLIKPFDKYTWAWVAAAVTAIAAAFACIDYLYAFWKNLNTRNIFFKSN